MSGNAGRSAEAVRAILVDRFPRCFVPSGHGPEKRPLKIGITPDILARAPDLTKKEVNRGLAGYVAGPWYALNHKAGAIRIDLDGNAAGAVTEREASMAFFRGKRMAASAVMLKALREIEAIGVETEGEAAIRKIAVTALALVKNADMSSPPPRLRHPQGRLCSSCEQAGSCRRE